MQLSSVSGWDICYALQICIFGLFPSRWSDSPAAVKRTQSSRITGCKSLMCEFTPEMNRSLTVITLLVDPSPAIAPSHLPLHLYVYRRDAQLVKRSSPPASHDLNPPISSLNLVTGVHIRG
jgi:hypothetical protein